MKNSSGKITKIEAANKSLNLIALPGLTLFLTIVSIFVALFVGYGDYKKLSAELDQSKNEEELLQKKLNTLSVVDSANIDPSSKSAIALSDTNPSTVVISQMRKLASENNLSLSDTRVDTDSSLSKEIKKANIKFVLIGSSYEEMTSFVKSLGNSAPLTTLTKASFSGSDGVSVKATIDLSTYWSSYPNTLPPIEKPIQELTPSETQTLKTLTILDVPPFTVLNPSDPSDRENPFE